MVTLKLVLPAGQTLGFTLVTTGVGSPMLKETALLVPK